MALQHNRTGLICLLCFPQSNISNYYNCVTTKFTQEKRYSETVFQVYQPASQKYRGINSIPKSCVTHLKSKTFNSYKHAKPGEHAINKGNKWHKCDEVGNNPKHQLGPHHRAFCCSIHNTVFLTIIKNKYYVCYTEYDSWNWWTTDCS